MANDPPLQLVRTYPGAQTGDINYVLSDGRVRQVPLGHGKPRDVERALEEARKNGKLGALNR